MGTIPDLFGAWYVLSSAESTTQKLDGLISRLENELGERSVPINPDDLGGTDIASLEAAYCKVSGYVADAAAEESARIQQQK